MTAAHRPFRRNVAVLATAWLLVTSFGAIRPGDDPKKIVLFDGKSLDGWKKADFYKPGEVKIEDGKIVMQAGPKMTGITSTRKDLPKLKCRPLHLY